MFLKWKKFYDLVVRTGWARNVVEGISERNGGKKVIVVVVWIAVLIIFDGSISI